MPQEAGIRARPEEGALLGRGSQSVLVRLRVWGESEGGWAVFPFPGKKKNNPVHGAKNRAESRPGLWPGRGGCSFLGPGRALAGLGPAGEGVVRGERLSLPRDAGIS